MSEQTKRYDITGFDMEKASDTFAIFKGIFYVILGWASIGVETFLRKDFGERYYTRNNFFIGFLFLFSFMGLASIFAAVQGSIAGDFFMETNPAAENRVVGPFFFIFFYLIFGFFHFWRIWVRKQIVEPQYSLYDGTPRLEALGKIVMKIVNPIAKNGANFLAGITLNKEDREVLKESMDRVPIHHDAGIFTKIYIEPVFVLLVGALVPGIPFFWALICTVALVVHTRMGLEGRRDLELDFTDSVIMTQAHDQSRAGKMRDSMDQNYTDMVMDRMKIPHERRERVIKQVREEKPDLMATLDELDIDLSGGDDAD